MNPILIPLKLINILFIFIFNWQIFYLSSFSVDEYSIPTSFQLINMIHLSSFLIDEYFICPWFQLMNIRWVLTWISSLRWGRAPCRASSCRSAACGQRATSWLFRWSTARWSSAWITVPESSTPPIIHLLGMSSATASGILLKVRHLFDTLFECFVNTIWWWIKNTKLRYKSTYKRQTSYEVDYNVSLFVTQIKKYVILYQLNKVPIVTWCTTIMDLPNKHE